jgi:hypothetical protein
VASFAWSSTTSTRTAHPTSLSPPGHPGPQACPAFGVQDASTAVAKR